MQSNVLQDSFELMKRLDKEIARVSIQSAAFGSATAVSTINSPPFSLRLPVSRVPTREAGNSLRYSDRESITFDILDEIDRYQQQKSILKKGHGMNDTTTPKTIQVTQSVGNNQNQQMTINPTYQSQKSSKQMLLRNKQRTQQMKNAHPFQRRIYEFQEQVYLDDEEFSSELSNLAEEMKQTQQNINSIISSSVANFQPN